VSQPWYIKRADGTVAGPFPERDVSADLLSGRIDDGQSVRQGETGPWCAAARARTVFRQLADVGWYIRNAQEVFGPFTDARILQLHRDGELDPNAELRQGTKANWKSAEAVLSIFQNQKVPEARKEAASDDLKGYDSSESIGNGKWSIEPMRHAIVDLEVHYANTAKKCSRLEHLLLQRTDEQQMGDRLLVTRTNGDRVGYLGLENSQQILSNSERGMSHVTLLHSDPTITPIAVAVVLCPPGSSSEGCKRYIDEQFHPQPTESN